MTTNGAETQSGEWAEDGGEEGEQQQLVHDGGRRGRLFVVNYGEEMFAGNGGRFRMALKAVRDQISDICCLGELGGMCAIIFCNSSKTNEAAENIENIFVYRQMGTMDVELVKKLDTILKADDPRTELDSELGGSGVCNWAELLFLCQKLFRYGHRFRKKFIHIFTTDRERIMGTIKSQVKKRSEEIINSGITVSVFLLDDPEIPDDQDQDNVGMSEFWSELDPDLTRCSELEKLQSGLRLKNFAFRSTISLPFKMADNFQFAVGLYYLIKIQTKPVAVNVDTETGERVEQRVHFIPEREEEANGSGPLPSMMEGERFEGEVGFRRDVGGVDVVLEREELEKLRRLDQPGITVIGFKPLDRLKESHRMGPATFIYPIDSVMSGSSTVYRALLKRCLERKLFILVRYTHKRNTAPKLCALVPQSVDDKPNECSLPNEYFYEGFHLLELPFAEKSRKLEKRFQPPDDLGIWPSASSEQVDAAKQFVRKLVNTKFSPDNFANPMLQQHYKAVETVALDLEFDKFKRETADADQLRPYFENPNFEKRVVAELAKFKEVCDEGSEDGRKRVKKEKIEEENEEDGGMTKKRTTKKSKK